MNILHQIFKYDKPQTIHYEIEQLCKNTGVNIYRVYSY
jgi:hypothetical protein